VQRAFLVSWRSPGQPGPRENDIKFLRIQNFKSIKEVTLHPRLIHLLEAIKRAQPPTYRELAQFVAEVMDENGKLWQPGSR